MMELDPKALKAARAAIVGNPLNDDQIGRIVSAYLAASAGTETREAVAINAALDDYVQALILRQHGGSAQSRAFNAICRAMGRDTTRELDAIRALSGNGDGNG